MERSNCCVSRHRRREHSCNQRPQVPTKVRRKFWISIVASNEGGPSHHHRHSNADPQGPLRRESDPMGSLIHWLSVSASRRTLIVIEELDDNSGHNCQQAPDPDPVLLAVLQPNGHRCLTRCHERLVSGTDRASTPSNGATIAAGRRLTRLQRIDTDMELHNTPIGRIHGTI
jgi:hypothetical protein